MSTALTLYVILSVLFLVGLLYIGWLLRKHNNISIGEKVSYVSVLLIFGIVTPYMVYSVLGSPTEVEYKKLPDDFNLLAVQNPDEHHIYIWINNQQDFVPKSIEVVHLTKQDRKVLQRAARMLHGGKQVTMRKNDKGEKGDGKGDVGEETDEQGGKGKDSDSEGDQDSESISDGSFHIVSPKYHLKPEG